MDMYAPSHKNITFDNMRALRMLARRTVSEIIALKGAGGDGGYLYLSDCMGNTRMHECIGDPCEGCEKCHERAAEMAMRLRVNHPHKSSWQSRNVEKNQLGGAIRLPSGFILAFSGFSELFNEAYCVGLASAMHWLDAKERHDILVLSQNSTTDVLEIMDILGELVMA